MKFKSRHWYGFLGGLVFLACIARGNMGFLSAVLLMAAGFAFISFFGLFWKGKRLHSLAGLFIAWGVIFASAPRIIELEPPEWKVERDRLVEEAEEKQKKEAEKKVFKAKQKAKLEAKERHQREKQYGGKFYGTSGNFDLYNVDLAFDEDSNASITGTVVNNSDRSYGYVQVQAKLYDSAGNVTGSPMTNVNNIGPGESWRFDMNLFGQDFSSWKIERVSGL